MRRNILIGEGSRKNTVKSLAFCQTRGEGGREGGQPRPNSHFEKKNFSGTTLVDYSTYLYLRICVFAYFTHGDIIIPCFSKI